ncbi:MAG: hypothetical protein II453_06815, partial [Alphaproteobacteria bacterium]|nr:hypothetical protein [Alphaproteobacteria bacterium]
LDGWRLDLLRELLLPIQTLKIEGKSRQLAGFFVIFAHHELFDLALIGYLDTFVGHRHADAVAA